MENVFIVIESFIRWYLYRLYIEILRGIEVNDEGYSWFLWYLIL